MSSAATVGAALDAARAAGLDRLDAQLLLGALMQRPRTWLLAHREDGLDAELAVCFETLVARRADGEPLAYLVGEKEFFGLALHVSPAVLVPRPDTETLVEWALERLASAGPAPTVLDLGTGSGAVALAIAHRHPGAQVTAVDASAAALAVASGNGRRLGLTVEWQLGDWFSGLGSRRFDLIVGNPPYVARGDPHLDSLRHEPQAALVAGADGLDDLRSIVEHAPTHLPPGGWLLLEHGHQQADAVVALLTRGGFRDVATRQDLAGRPRCTAGRCAADVHKRAEPRV